MGESVRALIYLKIGKGGFMRGNDVNHSRFAIDRI